MLSPSKEINLDYYHNLKRLQKLKTPGNSLLTLRKLVGELPVEL